MNEKHQAAENDAVDLVSLTADVVSAYVSNNTVPVAELVGLVASVHAALGGLGKAKEPAAPAYTPAVSVKKSVTEDAIISLIDGKPYRTLKRHLTGHGLTPAEYRQRYNLPAGYPMVAASYAAKRSELAKSIGLGANRRKAAAKVAASDPVIAEPAPKRRARKSA
jgi:predicted transcriptional regulator